MPVAYPEMQRVAITMSPFTNKRLRYLIADDAAEGAEGAITEPGYSSEAKPAGVALRYGNLRDQVSPLEQRKRNEGLYGPYLPPDDISDEYPEPAPVARSGGAWRLIDEQIAAAKGWDGIEWDNIDTYNSAYALEVFDRTWVKDLPVAVKNPLNVRGDPKALIRHPATQIAIVEKGAGSPAAMHDLLKAAGKSIPVRYVARQHEREWAQETAQAILAGGYPDFAVTWSDKGEYGGTVDILLPTPAASQETPAMVWWSDNDGRRVARSLRTLYDQVNAAYPGRATGSDGTIGDPAHQATRSEHNPDENGIVRALDITNSPSTGFLSRKLAEALINSRDPRIYYVISDGEIANPSIQNGAWRKYNGTNPHTGHVHISVVDDPRLYDDTSPWQIDAKPVDKVPGRQYGITCTYFGGPGNPERSAYDNHLITETEYGVALPYRFPGARPKVRVFKDGKSAVCSIVDVGPWNTNDPYWEKGARPQAESGYDMSGRKTNKAGIDVTPAVNSYLGINGKALVDWEFVKDDEPAPDPEPTPDQSALQAQITTCLRRLDAVETAVAELKRTAMPQNDNVLGQIDFGKLLKPVIDTALAEFNKQLPSLLAQIAPALINALLARYMGGSIFRAAGLAIPEPPPAALPTPAKGPNQWVVPVASATGGGTIVGVLTLLMQHFLGGG